jgi:hypothetical protein
LVTWSREIITARQSSRGAGRYRAGGAGVGEVAVTVDCGVETGRLDTGEVGEGADEEWGVSDECDSTGVDGPGVDGPDVGGTPGVASGEVDGSPSVVGASVSVVVGVVVGVDGRVCTSLRGAQV